MAKVAIDAGHGGSDPGAVYGERPMFYSFNVKRSLHCP